VRDDVPSYLIDLTPWPNHPHMFVVQISRADARDGVLNPTTRSRAMHLSSFAEPVLGRTEYDGQSRDRRLRYCV